LQGILGSRVTSRSVGRSKASNLLFGVLTKRPKHPGLRKVVTLRGEAVERRSWSAPQQEERLQPLRGESQQRSRRHRVLGISRGGEHALLRFIGAPMNGTRVLHSGITGPCCPSKQFGGLPSSPSWPDHRPQLPAPKGTARRPRGTVRRRTADGMALRLFSAARHRAERTWKGATASHGGGSTAHGRARVSESCCRDR
jgi:hypothetical protein